MLCVLRVYGIRLEEGDLTDVLGLAPYRTSQNNGIKCFNFDIAEAEDHPALLQSIKAFLLNNEARLSELNLIQGIDEKVLDIAVGFRSEKAALYVHLDQELVNRAAQAKLAVTLSIYKTADH